ncbi:MAG: DUF1127 domain-containing protein [Cellvibrionaceae bacterium]|nr:DUF1127 domain-containing protein [Cellvibrionaceae bacterium]
MLISKMLNPPLRVVVKIYRDLRARQRKRRSEHALARLDDRLLDDIGLRRVDDRIMPIAQVRNFTYRHHYRVRHPYLIRRPKE